MQKRMGFPGKKLISDPRRSARRGVAVLFTVGLLSSLLLSSSTKAAENQSYQALRTRKATHRNRPSKLPTSNRTFRKTPGNMCFSISVSRT